MPRWLQHPSAVSPLAPVFMFAGGDSLAAGVGDVMSDFFAQKAANLSSIALLRCRIDDRGAAVIATSGMAFPTLTHLDLSGLLEYSYAEIGNRTVLTCVSTFPEGAQSWAAQNNNRWTDRCRHFLLSGYRSAMFLAFKLRLLARLYTIKPVMEVLAIPPGVSPIPWKGRRRP